MIKIKKKNILLLAGLFMLAFSSCSRTGFRGVIEYKVTYPGSRIDYATQEALPSSVEVFANNNMVRKEMRGGELIQTQIMDSNEETIDILLEIMGNKYHIAKSRDDVRLALRALPEPEFQVTGETLEILGYECQKIKAITYDDFGEEYVSVIYFTTEIDGFPFNFDLPYRDIPGLMLLYEVRTGDINMRYEAERIRTRKRGSGRKSFRIPKDFQQITYEELRRKLE